MGKFSILFSVLGSRFSVPRFLFTFYSWLCAILFFGCERQFPLSVDLRISGYQVRGIVKDQLNNPVPYLAVRLWYGLEYVDSNPPPSKEYTVTDSTQQITVTVIDRGGQQVKVLFQGTQPTGPFEIDWNKQDAGGADARSGVYWVQYIVAGSVRKSYPVVVNGYIVTATNARGEYIIDDFYLPVGFYPVPDYSADGTIFYENDRISSAVVLEFVTPQRVFRKAVELTKDEITRLDVIIR